MFRTVPMFFYGVLAVFLLYALAMLGLARSVSGHASAANGSYVFGTLALASVAGACVAAIFWWASIRWFRKSPLPLTASIAGVLAGLTILIIQSLLLSRLHAGASLRYLVQLGIIAAVSFLAGTLSSRNT